MDKIEIYTDGAAKGNPGPGGYGVILRSGRFEKELSQGFYYTTNNIEYEYRASPMLVSITPSTGGADGGTEVTITGTGFLFSSLLSCLFGNVMLH